MIEAADPGDLKSNTPHRNIQSSAHPDWCPYLKKEVSLLPGVLPCHTGVTEALRLRQHAATGRRGSRGIVLDHSNFSGCRHETPHPFPPHPAAFTHQINSGFHRRHCIPAPVKVLCCFSFSWPAFIFGKNRKGQNMRSDLGGLCVGSANLI